MRSELKRPPRSLQYYHIGNLGWTEHPSQGEKDNKTDNHQEKPFQELAMLSIGTIFLWVISLNTSE